MSRRRNPAPQRRGVPRTPTAIRMPPMTIEAVRFSTRRRSWPEASQAIAGLQTAARGHQPNGRTSSMSSACERIIRRQQYRFSPRVSSTCRGSSPWRVRSTNAGNALPTTLPHVKHRTGMIMDSPIGLLPLLACAAAQRLLRELAPGVRDDQRAVVFTEQRLEIVVVEELNEASGDGGAHRVRLAHDAASLHVHVDVDRIDLPSRELQRVQDLQPSELERVHLHGDAVDPNKAAPLRHGRPRDRGLPLTARYDCLHASTSNFEPRSRAISPKLMKGPCGGRLASSMISRGFSLNSSGTDR